MSNLLEDVNYKCELCLYTTKIEPFYNNHILKCHNNKKKSIIFFCNNCKTEFYSLAALQDHTTNNKCVFVPNAKAEELQIEEPPMKRSRSTNVPKNTSQKIKETFLVKSSSSDEEEDDDVKCPKCELVLSSLDLEKHVRTHGGTFQCNICMTSFKQRYHLEIHKSKFHKIHITQYIPETKVEKLSGFRCQFCKKPFVTAAATKKHEAMAHYTRRFKNWKLQKANLENKTQEEAPPAKPSEIKPSKESIEKFYDETFYDLLEELESKNAEPEKVSETILEMPFNEFDVVKEEEIEFVAEPVSEKKQVAKPKKVLKKRLECVGCKLKFSDSLELWAHLQMKHFK